MKNSVRLVWQILILLLSCCVLQIASAEELYDLVLQGGRVIDPETGLDAIRNVAIDDGKIVKVSTEPLAGKEIVDVTSMVVAPGFIDLHSHTPTPLGQRYQAMDGVTTALELEYGAYPLDGFASHLATGKAVINYGASTGYLAVRLQVKEGIRQSHVLDPKFTIGWRAYWNKFRSLFSDPRVVYRESASDDELHRLRRLLEQGLEEGGLGIGLPLDYISEAVNNEEIRMIFNVAGARNAPVFVHIRRGVAGDPAGLIEVLNLAKETGAPLHVVHLQHSATKATHDFLTRIRHAAKEGLDVTTEAFPYNAGTVNIGAAVFDRDWQAIFGITYEDVEWIATGERLNEATWNEYHENYPNGIIVHHYVKEAWTREVIGAPDVMIASDAIPAISEDIKVAPQGIGTYSRVLGRFVRELNLLDLPTAIAKMTIMPAQRLEEIAPAFSKKGRLQVGADADITVFDPASVEDKATYTDPFQPSEGITHVLVNGTFVVRDAAFQKEVYPGRLLTATR